jgi:urease accessory protein
MYGRIPTFDRTHFDCNSASPAESLFALLCRRYDAKKLEATSLVRDHANPNKRRTKVKRILSTALTAMAMLASGLTVANAHVGIGDTSGFAHGFWHPIGGVDHVLAMVTVGLFAGQLGGRALYLVPAAFVSVMVIGGAAGFAGIPIPFIELGIGLSIVVLGTAVALGLRIMIAAAMALVGFFAFFHGYAHGAEMPETVAGLAYGSGFVIATSLLHGCGLTLGSMMNSKAGRLGETLVRAAGAFVAVVGVALVFGIM